MSQLIRKTAVAMAATAFISALTGIGSVPAYADNSSIQAKLCRTSTVTADALLVTGTNQDGQTVQWSPGHAVPSNTCVTTDGFWWKKGTTLSVSWSQGGIAYPTSCVVPNSNDDTFVCNLS